MVSFTERQIRKASAEQNHEGAWTSIANRYHAMSLGLIQILWFKNIYQQSITVINAVSSQSIPFAPRFLAFWLKTLLKNTNIDS